jgi:hypothetical protein
MTSKGTEDQDKSFKKTLYESLGVKEYWLFDPKGEWISQQLQGYRLRGETYEPITDSRSEPLQLRLAIEGKLIGFYREDTGEKLLVPDELAEALAQRTQELQQEIEARQQAEERAELERRRAEKLAAKLRELNVDPDSL